MDEKETERLGSSPKKTYVKPEITQVDLHAEEAVLGACKNSAQSGPTQAICNAVITCSTLAS